jgi:hypothetical protein
MKTDEHHPGQLVELRLGRAADFCVLLAFVVLISGWCGLVLVVSGQVVRGWAVCIILLVASLVLVIIRAARRRQSGPGTTKQGRSILGAWALRLMVLVAGTGGLLGALGDLGFDATYQVLEPQGPDGCRAVVRETSFLMSGGGEVFAVSGVGIGWRMSDWTADDGYRPIAAGSYTFQWGADSGILAIGGSATDPVWPGIHEVSCQLR